MRGELTKHFHEACHKITAQSQFRVHWAGCADPPPCVDSPSLLLHQSLLLLELSERCRSALFQSFCSDRDLVRRQEVG